MISILERQNIIIIKCSFSFIYSFQWNIFTGNGRIRFTTSLQIKYFRVNLSTYIYHLIVVS